MSRSDRVLADAEAVLRRHSERGKSLTSRARERRNASIMRRLGRIAGAAFAIIIAAMVAGWFMPLGTSGVMIVLGLLLITTLFFALLPGERAVSPDKLADTALTALPLKTEIWLENQRKALPAPASPWSTASASSWRRWRRSLNDWASRIPPRTRFASCWPIICPNWSPAISRSPRRCAARNAMAACPRRS